MLGNILPPYHTLQELNLDWILTQIKNMLRFIPDDGSVGQILRRTAHGAEWSNEQGGGGGAVNSVNGQTGDVVLTASDVGALPDTTPIPTKTSDLNNDSGFITAAGAPVQSVNGQTGTVTLSIPTKTSDLNNDSGFITTAGAPVQSVNGQTGAVTLSIPTKTSDLNNDSGFVDAAGAAAAAPVQSVNGMTGTVTLTPTTIVSRLGTTQTIAAGRPIVKIDVPPGKWLLSGYMIGNPGSSGWLAVNGVEPPQDSPLYGRCVVDCTYVNIIEVSQTTEFAWYNNSGTARVYWGNCNIMVISL